MIFDESITFDEEEISGSAGRLEPSTVRYDAEFKFIELLKAEDPEAFDILVTRYSPSIYRLLLRLTGDSEEAGDLTQETFLRALRSMKGFRGESGLKTWLFRIAINQSKNRFRWWNVRRRDKTTSIDTITDENQRSLHDTLSSNERTPEEHLLSAERESLIFSELEKLPEIYREAVLLCDVEGMTYEEIANVLEISIGTVKSRISRGRVELRKRLSDI